MSLTNLQKRLFKLSDKKYAEFQSKLTPGIDPSSFIGVRVPVLRKFAKEYAKEDDAINFLNSLPHKYYDENLLHGLLIQNIKDYDETLKRINEFLPYVDNWAVSDTMNPKNFKKNRAKLIKEIQKWVKSKKTYTCRFGVDMLMSHFLDEDFKEEYLKIPASIKSNEYYVNMMIAWFYATALAKQWDETIKYLKDNKLNKWVHNKTIQKAIESYRISDSNKEYLRSLKRTD